MKGDYQNRGMCDVEVYVIVMVTYLLSDSTI